MNKMAITIASLKCEEFREKFPKTKGDQGMGHLPVHAPQNFAPIGLTPPGGSILIHLNQGG